MTPTTQLLTEPYFKYKQFLNECKSKEYDKNLILHKHHIIPKCLGGSNAKSNLIKVSVDDHITAHLMLAGCFDAGSAEQISNLRSARLLNKNSIKDEDVMREIAKTFLGEDNPFYGKYHTEEAKQKMSEATKDKLTGVSYEQRYGNNAENQKQIRSKSNKKVWASRTIEDRKAISAKVSQKLKGNPAWNKGIGRIVLVDDNKFSSITAACKQFNTSRYLLLKNYKVTFLEEV